MIDGISFATVFTDWIAGIEQILRADLFASLAALSFAVAAFLLQASAQARSLYEMKSKEDGIDTVNYLPDLKSKVNGTVTAGRRVVTAFCCFVAGFFWSLLADFVSLFGRAYAELEALPSLALAVIGTGYLMEGMRSVSKMMSGLRID